MSTLLSSVTVVVNGQSYTLPVSTGISQKGKPYAVATLKNATPKGGTMTLWLPPALVSAQVATPTVPVVAAAPKVRKAKAAKATPTPVAAPSVEAALAKADSAIAQATDARVTALEAKLDKLLAAFGA